MAAQRGGDDGEEPESLFDDLDRFFTPISDPDWPEIATPRPGGPTTEGVVPSPSGIEPRWEGQAPAPGPVTARGSSPSSNASDTPGGGPGSSSWSRPPPDLPPADDDEVERPLSGSAGRAGDSPQVGPGEERGEPAFAEPPLGDPDEPEPDEPDRGDEGLSDEASGEPVPYGAGDPQPPGAEDAPTAAPAGGPAGTGEEPAGAGLGSQDWSRLRDVLGEEEGDDAFELDARATEPPSPSEPSRPYEPPGPPEPPSSSDLWGPGMEEGDWTAGPPEDWGFREPVAPGGPELTLDDLKKAPPEYAELPTEPEVPGPGFESMWPEPEEPSTEWSGVGTDRAEDVWSEAGPGPPAVGSGGGGERPLPPRPGGREPSLAEVEAAADQLAQEFRRPAVGDEDVVPAAPAEPRRIKVGEPESLMGPAWEEPSSRTLMGEPEPPRPAARNLPVAVITAAALALLALFSLAIDKWVFAVVAGVVVLLGQAELYAALQHRGHQPATALGLVAGGVTLAGAYFRGEQGMVAAVAVALVMSFLWYMVAPPKARAGLMANVGATALGIVYVPFLAGFALMILTQANSGEVLLLAVLGLTFWYDVAAFAIGTLWGDRPLAPTISPKKSWEGLFGATVATFAVAIAILPGIDIITATNALGLAAVVVVFAPLGDLAESALKRDLGVKDMGSILPGHGGILDRIDALLFVAPAAFYFLRLVF